MVSPSYKITKKAVQPEWLTLADAKEQLRVRHNYEDDYISDCIAAAVDEAEGYLSSFIDQRDVEITLSVFPKELNVMFGPVFEEVFSVSYYDETGASQILSGAYRLEHPFGEKSVFKLDPTVTLPKIAERSDAVSFTYVAGGTADALPGAIKKALQLMVAEMYEFRTDRSEILNTRAKALMRGYKVWD